MSLFHRSSPASASDGAGAARHDLPVTPDRSVNRKRAVLGFVATAALIAAVSFLGWYWHDRTRPGMRHCLQGMQYLDQHNPAQAEHEWLAGIREDPSDYRCYEMLGDFQMELRRFPLAAAAYEKAAQLARWNGSLYLRCAVAYGKAGIHPAALPAARRASELMPNDADAVGGYGIELLANKNRPEALKQLRRAHELRPADRTFFMGVITAEMDMLELAAAERDLAPYAQAHPNDPEALLQMAVLYNQKPRTPENLKLATEYAQKAVVGNPSDVRGYTLLGQLYLDQGRLKEAHWTYLAGYRVSRTNEGILRGLADCYGRMGDSRELALVSAEFRKVLTRHSRIDHLVHVMGFDAKDITSGLELARLEEEEGERKKAVTYYEQLVRQAPDDPRTRKGLSGFYRRIGRADLAVQALNPQYVP